jgi:hypothetical protein
MIGKKVRNLLICAGLASAAIAVVPAVSQAKYTGKIPPNMAAVDMVVDQPVVTKTAAVKHVKLKKHTATRLASAKTHAAKKSVHTTTIKYKKHHHKKSPVAKTKKHAA